MISAVHLRKLYRSAVVLDDVSFDLDGGQCLALLGANGAGKTTLLRMLGTLLRPDSGQLALGGIDAIKSPEAARPLLGVVAHGSHVYEDLTALENLRFWTVMANGDTSRDRLRAALRQVELDGVADERARTFSSGMKRRLALARVLLSRARILLLDEPFTGLDQRGRKWLTEFILGFKADGGAVVMATHSFGTGLDAADRVAIIGGGRIVVDRSSADLSWEELHRLYESCADAPGADA